jgi:cytochrome c oxidase subunit IV
MTRSDVVVRTFNLFCVVLTWLSTLAAMFMMVVFGVNNNNYVFWMLAFVFAIPAVIITIACYMTLKSRRASMIFAICMCGLYVVPALVKLATHFRV